MHRVRYLRAVAVSVLKRHVSQKLRLRSGRLPFVGTVGTCSYAHAVTTVKSSENLTPPEPSTLTHSYLIRNAAAASVDSAITLLNQTVAALLQTHEQYMNTLKELEQLMELRMHVLGNEWQEERVWDQILKVRNELSEHQRQKDELELLFSSLERLVNNAAEAAFLSGADYASEVANERLYAAQQKLTQVACLSKDAQEQITKMEVKIIEETTKRVEERTKEKDSEEDKESSAVSSVVGIEVSEDTGGTVTSPQEQEGEGWLSRILGTEQGQEEPDAGGVGNDREQEEEERKWANAR